MFARKISSLVVILLATTITNLYSMKRPREEHISDLVSKILLGSAKPRILQEELSLEDLPQDILHQIVQLTSLYSTATSLQDAVSTVNSLAMVNTSLYTKLNNPTFCLQLIKDLAKKFNCTDYDACKALKIPASKQRLNLQLELYALCRNAEPINSEGYPMSPKHYGIFERNIIHQELPVDYDFEGALNGLRQQNVDLEFTYPVHLLTLPDYNRSETLYQNGLTPLMIALTKRLQPQQETPEQISINYKKIPILLISHGANINGTNNNGDTALMLIAIEGQLDMLQSLFQNSKQPIDVNKRNNQGYTALMYSAMNIPNTNNIVEQLNYFEIINYLVLAGANPNIMDNEGWKAWNYGISRGQYFARTPYLLPTALQGQLTKELSSKTADYLRQPHLHPYPFTPVANPFGHN